MISIRVDTSKVEHALEGAAKQIPFATARALTLTAQAAQAELRSALDQDFTIRNEWASKGIRIVPARKSSLQAEVGSRDRFMALQAEGGVKEGKGGGAVAVPVEARPSPKSITRPSRWPGKLLDGGKARAFKADLPGPTVAVFKVKGKGSRRTLSLMHLLVRQVQVPKRWPFADRVEAAASKAWPELAARAVAEALATARKRAGA